MRKHIGVQAFVALLICVSIPLSVKAISYEHFSDGYLTSIHVIIVDPKEHHLTAVTAVDRETVLTLANHYGAIAAVNGGFWKKDGNPAGILKIDHRWYGTATKPRGAIGWSLFGERVLIDQLLTHRAFGEIEVIPASVPPYTTPDEWRDLEYIVGGSPILVRGGRIVEDHRSEKTLESFLENKHPRTAVGIRENGDWVFVVVDSQFHCLFGGMTINELAKLMLRLDCWDALNLDGGRSSTMVLEGAVVNRPCGTIQEQDKSVTAVSDAILIF